MKHSRIVILMLLLLVGCEGGILLEPLALTPPSVNAPTLIVAAPTPTVAAPTPNPYPTLDLSQYVDQGVATTRIIETVDQSVRWETLFRCGDRWEVVYQENRLHSLPAYNGYIVPRASWQESGFVYIASLYEITATPFLCDGEPLP